MESAASIVDKPSQQKKSIALVQTESSEIQQVTEGECAPFFVDLATLRKHSQDHLRETGLLPTSTDAEQDDGHSLDVCLLRDKHFAYLSRVFLPSEQPLGRNLVSLDASRPWMMYWTLHGCDLLLVPPPENTDQIMNDSMDDTTMGDSTPEGNDASLLHHKIGDPALSAIVSTLEACWQSIGCLALPPHVGLTLTDQERSLLETATVSPIHGNNATTYYSGGGFGGGPGQMAHVATTYAAVLTLCIVATSSEGPAASSSIMAWKLLERIRSPMYAWFLSLQQPHGGFRMHHDGEIDVRASYTLFCVAKLLNMLTPTLASSLTVDFIASCQTYEGGFGGEPFTEAHGGYAYCAVAALQLVDRLDKTSIDLDALRGWLARRQLGYEGGFSGRANKLVDGCYSFWQGGAMAIVSAHYTDDYEIRSTAANANKRGDIWLPATSNGEEQKGNNEPLSYALLFDKPMLQRYILLCAQDVSGGLRDKPSKPRDFYHSCYNLSGLALSQHSGSSPSLSAANSAQEESYQHNFGHPMNSRVADSHPCYNIRLSRVQAVLEHFKSVS